MRNEELWKPSKFEMHKGSWRASRTYVQPSSWLMADRCAESYAKSISQHARGRVIDVGCGPVPLYGMYRPKADSIVCVDWQNSLHDVNFCDSFLDLNEKWDLPSDSFDTVIATDVLEHLYAPATFFSEVARICAPGGKLILGVPFFYWIHEAPHDHLRHTESSLRRFCELNALTIEDLYAVGGAPEVLVDIVFKVLRLRGFIGNVAYSLARAALSIGMVRSASMKTRKSFPMAYVLVASKDALRSPNV